MRVLVVEDEVAVADSVRMRLERSGFVVDVARDGEDGWFAGDTEDFSAVILDLGLPTMDGLTILKRWRKEGRSMPVIVLTARGSWKERVEGIDAGADDYLPKPFQLEELIARLHAVMRRTAGQASNVMTIGPVTVDSRRKVVTVEGASVDLTPLEFRLLSCLAFRSGAVVSAVDLLDHLYGQNHDKEVNVLEVLLGRLRRKIGAEVIGTRRGQGYYLKVR
jgi:DNA-binding response OmpR family regulator